MLKLHKDVVADYNSLTLRDQLPYEPEDLHRHIL